jgi:DNA adenine methylase
MPRTKNNELGLFKWVGGKRQMLPTLLEHVPAFTGVYREPFAGGAALFWELARMGRLSHGAALSDVNVGLMDFYRILRDHPTRLLIDVASLSRQYLLDPENTYYLSRQLWNDGVRDPARFWLLVQTSFNGLWRTNSKGLLNMPWNHSIRIREFSEDAVLGASRLLQGAALYNQHWEGTVVDWKPGDFVYADPPYLGVYAGYAPGGFSRDAHEKLLAGLSKAAHAGVHVLLTNQDSPLLRELLAAYWPAAQTRVIPSKRSINCVGTGRGAVPDLLVWQSPANGVAGDSREDGLVQLRLPGL